MLHKTLNLAPERLKQRRAKKITTLLKELDELELLSEEENQRVNSEILGWYEREVKQS